jgi:CHAT domain-containing protein/Tfp pilus assembly protein PilF
MALLISETWGDQGNWEAALESAQDGLGAAEGLSAQIAAWLAMGKAYEGQNVFKSAQSAYTVALEYSQMSSPESLVVAKALMSLGLIEWYLGDLDTARDLFFQAVCIQEQLAPKGLDVAESLSNLGAVALDRGNIDSAADYFRQALRLQERLAPRSLRTAENLSNLGLAVGKQGDLDGAQGYYLQALQIEEELAPQSLNVAGSLNNLGALAIKKGELESANSYLIQALRIEKRLVPGSLYEAFTLNNLGAVAWIRGDLDRAYNYDVQAFDIRAQLAPESLGVASSLNNLGVVAWTRREFNRAKEYHLKALQILKRIAPHSLDVASSLGNLGSVATSQGDLGRAYELHLQALRIEESIAPQSLDMSLSLNNLGAIARAQRDLDLAHEYHSRSLKIRERLAPQSIEVALSLSHLSFIAYDRSNLQDAEHYAFEAVRIIKHIDPEGSDMALIINHLGDIARVRGDPDLAEKYYSQALDVLESQIARLGGSYDVQGSFRTQYRKYHNDAMNHALAQARYYEAFDLLERYRAQTFLVMLTEREVVFSADVPEELDRERRRLAVLFDRSLKRLIGLNLRDHAEEIRSVRKDLEVLRHEAGDIEARIRQASPRLAALRYPRPLDTTHAREALDSDTLLLSYSISEEESTLFVMSQTEDLRVKVLPVGGKVLRPQVERLRSLILETKRGSSLSHGRAQLLKEESRALYDLLLGSVAEQIAASERLLILPDGPLHDLPFAALIRSDADDEADDQYLVEWKPLHVALSTTVFAELKQQRRANRKGDATSTRMRIAAFGDPVYPAGLTVGINEDLPVPVDTAEADSQGSTVLAQIVFPADPTVRSAAERGIFDWPPLPYTRREVEGIANVFPEGTVQTFLGAEATEERIKSLNRDTRILHIAAHGHTDEHLPSSSFIALTIPEDVFRDDADSERDNGLLQVWEIFERVRIDADLVVLSACESGLGQNLGTEGLIGLTRAFQYAGARSVVASLWSVADQSTAELMIRFYRHLRDGLSKDEALRAAQIELIRGPIEVTDADGRKVRIDASAPYYWAAFQIFGDWQ